MPNWCENQLSIRTENKEQLQEFIETVKDSENKTDLSFEKILPHPTDRTKLLLDKPKQLSLRDELISFCITTSTPDWNVWSIRNWGTKWDVQAELNIKESFYALYLFDSAWNPPLQWISMVALKYPDLYFQLKYDEAEIGYMGVFTAHGEETSDKGIEYSICTQL